MRHGLRKIRYKISRFVGAPRIDAPPLFMNSMPKAGTNLLESFICNLGYKRNLARCLNESNISKINIKPSRGYFYVAHLTEDGNFHSQDFLTVFLKRNLWDCMESYVNYMYFDTKHPVSAFLRNSSDTEAINNLYFTKNNPNRRPLISEYLRFYELNLGLYDLCIDFKDLANRDEAIIYSLSDLFGKSEKEVFSCLDRALNNNSLTKNNGKVDLFSAFDSQSVLHLKEKVQAYIGKE